MSQQQQGGQGGRDEVRERWEPDPSLSRRGAHVEKRLLLLGGEKTECREQRGSRRPGLEVLTTIHAKESGDMDYSGSSGGSESSVIMDIWEKTYLYVGMWVVRKRS